jgi:SnoaL-like domain
MTTTASTHLDATPSIAAADRAIANGERILWHARTEATNDTEAIMATVTPRETLSWATSYAWSAPELQPDGTVKLTTKTTTDGIVHFYTSNRQRYRVVLIDSPQVRISSDWYSFLEAEASFEAVGTGVRYAQTWLLLAPLDGKRGITGEIAWGRFPQLEPAATITDVDRAQLHEDYVAALRAADVEALLGLMAPGVQGAVRDVVGAGDFVSIDGAAQMRAHYERLFAAARVRNLGVVQVITKPWYLFSELRWDVEIIAGPGTGQRARFLTAEHLALDPEGRIYARSGYASAVLS